jgi:ribose 5-phosphate isomerase B
VIDGAGLGSTIAANKVPGARAAMCLNVLLARYARQHNGANVLSLGSTLVARDDALAIVDAFIDTPMREARYIRRLAKIRDLERAAWP